MGKPIARPPQCFQKHQLVQPGGTTRAKWYNPASHFGELLPLIVLCFLCLARVGDTGFEPVTSTV